MSSQAGCGEKALIEGLLAEKVGRVEFMVLKIVVGDARTQALVFVQTAAAHALEVVRDQATQLSQLFRLRPDFF